MDLSFFKRNRISIILIGIIAISLLFFIYSLYSARQRSNQVEEAHLQLIVNNLQLENRIVFSGIETALKIEAKKIETGGHEILNGQFTLSSLKNLIDISEKVAVIGVVSEDGVEYVVHKRNNLYATYVYASAKDSLAKVIQYDSYEKQEVSDSLVGNRLYNTDLFKIHRNVDHGQIIWRPTSNLPGFSGRKGVSASTMVTESTSGKQYIIIFFVPFKRLMTNTVKAGFTQGDVFIFRSDSLYFNFDGSIDSARGFDTTRYFISWNEIPVKRHAAAVHAWQSLGHTDSIAFARFSSDGVNYCAAFSPVLAGYHETYYGLVVPSSTLPTLLRSRTGILVSLSFVLMLASAIVLTVIYLKNFRKIRFDSLSADKIKQLIAVGESDLLEFKSTIRTNLHAGKPGKEIELAWLKSVVAFCNTEGGTILIGVKDDGEIVGLEADHFQNDDKCLLHVQHLISEHVGLEYLPYVRFTLVTIEDKKVLAVQCAQLKRIMLLKSAGKEQFYVRSGPSSIELPVSKVLEYVNERGKRF